MLELGDFSSPGRAPALGPVAKWHARLVAAAGGVPLS
jgi:hypothetical protein